MILEGRSNTKEPKHCLSDCLKQGKMVYKEIQSKHGTYQSLGSATMFGKNAEKERLDIVLELYARAVNTLENQEPFLMLLLNLVNTHGLADKVDPKAIESMWESIQKQVNGAKLVLSREGKAYPPG
jgi:hypothetical protein